MRIAVVGLWHLGSVTAGCLAHLGHAVTAIDEDAELIVKFKSGKLPVDEPGLPEMIVQSMSSSNLNFSSQIKEVEDKDLVWVTYDTPVDDDDEADPEFVRQKIETLFPYFSDNTIVLISSQLPVGSTASLQRSFDQRYSNRTIHFCYSPENLRLGNAIKVFLTPDRIIVGSDSYDVRKVLENILRSLTDNIIWMSVASAEMTKHAINAFLANSIVFINEISLICERVGADAAEVEKGLKSEERIGPKAYLKPGNAFAGGTLARDISYLINQQQTLGLDDSFFKSISHANREHRKWIQHAILQYFPKLSGITISVLGLTYKPGTNTLRRSQAVEFCKWATENGAIVQAYDPAVDSMSLELTNIVAMKSSVQEAIWNADLIVVATSWPVFKEIQFDTLWKKQVVVIDPNGFLLEKFSDESNYQYIKIGKKNEAKK